MIEIPPNHLPNDPYEVVVLMAKIEINYRHWVDRFNNYTGVEYVTNIGWWSGYGEYDLEFAVFYPHGADLRASFEAAAWAKNPGLGLKCSVLFQELFGDPEETA